MCAIAEHVTAITVSVKDKLMLSLSVAVGSSIVRIRLSFFCRQYLRYLILLDSKLHSSLFRTFWWGVLMFQLTSLRSSLVILGWILGKPLTLLFDTFESIVLFLSGEASPLLSLQPYCSLMVMMRSRDRQLCRPKWQVKLARGHDSYVCVYPNLRLGWPDFVHN